MRYCQFLFFMITYLFFFVQESTCQNWTQLQDGSVYDVTAISFPSADTGYVISLDNSIRRTTNGGNSWVLLNTPNIYLNDIKFRSGSKGYVCGDSSSFGNKWASVFETTDGGITWTRVLFKPSKTFTGLFLSNDSTLYLKAINWMPSDSVTLYKSFDNGMNWVQNRIDPITVGNQGLEFYSTDTGYYTVDYKLYSTFDGGATWQQRYDGTPSTDSFYNFYFPSVDTGYAIGIDFILETTDKGQNWIRKNIPSVQGLDLFFSSGLNGFICGADLSGNGWIERTNDGGSTWSMEYQSIPVFNSFDFPTDSVGYAGGHNGIVLKYTLGPASVSENHSSINFTLLPNPAKGDVILKNIPANSTIRIMDAGGKTVYTGIAASTEMRIDVSAYAPGIYFAEVTEGKAVSRKKFVKE